MKLNNAENRCLSNIFFSSFKYCAWQINLNFEPLVCKTPERITRVISVSHKVKISERFKSHSLQFKGQGSNLKHVEKIDGRKLNAENVQ